MDQVSKQIKVFLKVGNELSTQKDAIEEALQRMESEIVESDSIISEEIQSKNLKGFI